MSQVKKELQTLLKKVNNRKKYLIDIVAVRKNRQTRMQLGISIEDQKDLIYGLQECDYYQGPLQDHDQSKPEDVWLFKKRAFGVLFYIKLKVVENRNTIRVISCHIDHIL